MIRFKNLPVFKLDKIKTSDTYFDLMLEFSNGLINQKKNKKIINFLNQRYLTEESNTSQMAKGSTRSIHADRFIKILKKFYKKILKIKYSRNRLWKWIYFKPINS